LNKRFNLQSDGTPALFKLIRDFKSRHVPQEPVKKEEAKKEPVREDKKEEEPFDDYSEDFEEIEEDIEAQSIDTGKESQRYFESMGSSGVDPSVDSTALEQCDYQESVKRPRN
jgi:hypothetical protein